jgi:GxxExxY protein
LDAFTHIVAMAAADLKHADITQAVITAFFKVYNAMGHGFLEARYASALERELRNVGRHVAREYATRVYYQGEEIGYHRLDMVVDLTVVVELKAHPVLPPFARRQLMNYLRATNLEVGLLLHFGPKPKVERIFIPNDPLNRPKSIKVPAPWDQDWIDELIEFEKRMMEEEREEGWRVDDDDLGGPASDESEGWDDDPDAPATPSPVR